MSSPALAERMSAERLFFALWPDPALAARVFHATRGLAGGAGGHPVVLEDLHLTLAFLGAVDAGRRACCETAASALGGAPFTLVLDQVGHWPGSQILWLGCARPPPALTRLVESLTAALAACGHVPQARGFQPHVTLARRVGAWRPAPSPAPIDWSVEHLCLAASAGGGAGVRYRILRRWPLRRAAPG